MMRVSVLILIMLCSVLGLSQNPFNNTYGGLWDDMTSGIMIIDSNKFIISYTDEGFTNGPMALYVNNNGDSLTTYIDYSFYGWHKSYHKLSPDKYYATGGYYVLNESKHDVLLQLIEVDSTILVRRYGGSDYDYGEDIIILPDSGFMIVGKTKSYGAGDYDVYIIRTDKNGDSLWTRTYGMSGYDVARSIEYKSDSTYFVSGTTSSFGAQWTDVFVMEIDLNGDTSLFNLYGNIGNDVSNAMVRTSDKGYAITGWQLYNTSIDGEFLLLKLDSNANQVFLKTYGYVGMDEAFDIKECYDHGFIMVGYSEQPNRGEDVYIVRTDSIGDTLWTKTLGGAYNERAYSVVQTPDSGFAIVGNTYSYGAGGSDAFFLKIKPNGDITTAIGLQVKPNANSISVSPNPATDNISISFRKRTNGIIQIRSISGSLIKSFNVFSKQQIKLNISSIAKGLYIVVYMPDDNSEAQFSKLIIQ